ncbi:M16 family metallopeptidase [Tundrisphaera lichenicola]|uniref:M16 family metallopeptidase n=1 Tax=Tundrisphaera lichenicola TaxID=2029860 RepID=UPI003EBBA9E6
MAAGLGQFALNGDWRSWQAEHRAAIGVQAEDVRRVASAYLTETNLTVGWSIPVSTRSVTVLLPDEARSVVERPTPASVTQPPISLEITTGASKLADYSPQRMTFPNGLRLLTERRPGAGVVALELYVDAGLLRERKPGLAYLMGRMLEEGTTSRTAEEIAESIEDIGGAMEVGSTGASLRVRAEDLPMAIEWLADLTMRPTFPEEALTWARRKTSAELQSDRDDPAFRADLIFRGLVYGDHPYSRDPRGNTKEIARITREDIVDHHRRYFHPQNAFLVAVGDFDPRKLQSLVKSRFGNWSGHASKPPRLSRLTRSSRPKVRRVASPGEQVHILMGHLGIARTHPDFDALAVADHILGSGPGFTDRLSRVIRDELGLAYSVGGGMTESADLEPGLFRIYLGTGPDDADHAIAAVMEQVRLLHSGDFEDEEVERARQYLAGSWVFDYQTVEQRAERLLELEHWGLDLDEPIHWPDRVARVTPRQVRRATRTYLDPSALVRVEYGPIRRRSRNADAECA